MKVFMKRILSLSLLLFTSCLFPSQTRNVSVVKSDTTRVHAIKAMPPSSVREKEVKDMIVCASNHIKANKKKIQQSQANQYDAVTWVDSYQQEVNCYGGQLFSCTTTSDSLKVQIANFTNMSKRKQWKHLDLFKATFLDQQCVQNIENPSKLIEFYQQELAREIESYNNLTYLYNQAHNCLSQQSGYLSYLQQQEQMSLANIAHYQGISSDMLDLRKSEVDLKWRRFAFSLKNRDSLGQMKNIAEQRKDALVKIALKVENSRLQQEKSLRQEKENALNWQNLGQALNKKRMIDSVRVLAIQKKKDLEGSSLQVESQQQKLDQAQKSLERKEDKKQRAVAKRLAKRLKQADDLQKEQERIEDCEEEERNKAKADHQRRKSEELIVLKEQQRQDDELKLQQSIQQKAELEQVSLQAGIDAKEAAKMVLVQQQEENKAAKKRSKRLACKVKKKAIKVVAQDEIFIAPYQQFLEDIKQKDEKRNEFIAVESRNKNLTESYRRVRLYELDKYETHFQVQSLLSEYVDIVCNDVIRLDKFTETQRWIVDHNKTLCLEGKSIAWYISLYPEMLAKCVERYAQLEQDEKSGMADLVLEDTRRASHDRGESIYNMNLVSLDLKILSEAFQSLKDKSDKDDKDLSSMRQIVKDKIEKQKELDALGQKHEAINDLISKIKQKYENHQKKMQLYQKMKVLQGTGGILSIARLSDTAITVGREGVLAEEEFDGKMLALESDIRAVLQSVEDDSIRSKVRNALQYFTTSSAVEKVDPSFNISEEKTEAIHKIVITAFEQMLIDIGLPSNDFHRLPKNFLMSARMLSPAYANYMLDIETLEYDINKKFIKYGEDHSLNYTQAQINDAVKMQVRLVKTIARMFHGRS